MGTSNKPLPRYFKYWGKAVKNEGGSDDAYHLLPYHCLDVAAVGQQLLCSNKPLTKALADFLELSPQQLNALFVFSLALHDLGKFASAFHVADRDNPLISASSRFDYDGSQYRHDRMGLYFWQNIELSFFEAAHSFINNAYALIQPDFPLDILHTPEITIGQSCLCLRNE
ncbi:HD domain-containing protein [Shewanella sp. YLB-07]|uniref:HD domain-containing protein n=1 Tax=Shewanella sp. YLB-07 TaxID=2601268 RepID=UPI00128D5294|nr:HD domain-containing protein [Shewanella sp. YLB-07]MPY25558.1 hypothetical protein [Shewanella sp. YLB-07]